ncbi:MAG TPA: hypothetical protein VF920_04050, partial [Dongiaceae bacterium]
MTIAELDHPSRSSTAYLQAIGANPEAAVDLAAAALACAALDRPDVDLASYRQHLAVLVTDLQQLARLDDTPADDDEATLAARVDMLRNVMAARHGYRGDESTY